MTELGAVSFLSLDAIRAELEIEREALNRISDTADNRAGLVLAFTAAIAAIAGAIGSWLAIPGLVAAAIAAVIAATVLIPRPGSTINPAALRAKYASKPEALTKHAVLDTRIEDYKMNQKRVRVKMRRLAHSIVAVSVSVVLVLLASAVDLLLKSLSR